MEIPLRSPPLGVSSDFTDAPFLGWPVVIIASLFLPLFLAFAAVRIYANIVVLKRWRVDDYVYFFSCALSAAMISFLISISFLLGYHAWDIDKNDMPKSLIVTLLGFWIALGPMLWLLKWALFSFVLSVFGSVRWLKNCAWTGIIVTGLIFSTYTIVVTMACSPRPESDSESYLNGINRQQCSDSSGVNAIVSIITSVANGVSNVYLLLISYPLVCTLPLQRRELHGAYLMLSIGAIPCICSFMNVYYRFKSWHNDLTGGQLPFYATFIIEAATSLIIPCIPSVWEVYRHFTVPDIDDTTTIATPTMKLLSSISSPQIESRATWRKTHDIEDLPFRKGSAEYGRPRDSRMKALPTTPLPLPPSPLFANRGTVPSDPITPKTPASFRSMSLPIMFHTSSSS